MTNITLDLRCFLVFLIMLSISACTPTGSNSKQVEMSDLIGLWNSSENAGAKIDVMYTRITSDGSIIEYDFDGDEADNGLKCFQVDSGSVKNIGANRFLIMADMHANNRFEVEMELLDAGNALQIVFFDSDDPSIILKSQIWTRVADEALLDDEPSCRSD